MTNISNLFNPISKITIENFQSHKETTIFPAPYGQLTVIVGQSRQGKTAIFRALRWLFYNAPDGDEFIRWGTTFARVTAEYADGSQVIRYRTHGGINRYIIRKPDQQGQLQDQVYEGFGRGAVPLEVQRVTGVSPVEIGDVKSGQGVTLNLNLAEQLDGPFLGNKSVSSTMRAKVLGKLAGTEEVDLASKTLGTDVFRWRQEERRLNGDPEKHIDGEIQDTQKKLDSYKYLPDLKANMDKLAGIRNKTRDAMDRREKLSALYQEYTIVSFRANNERLKILRCHDFINRMLPIIEAIEAHIQSASKINQAKTEWDKNSASILTTESTIRKTQGLSQAEELLKSAEGRFGRRQQAETIIAQWNKAVYDITQAEKIIDETQGIFEAEASVDLAQKDITKITSLIPINQQLEATLTRTWKAVWTLTETEGVPLAESSLAELYSSMDRKNKLAVVLDKWTRSKEDMVVVDRQMKRTNGLGSAYLLSGKIQEEISRHRGLTNLFWEKDSIKNNLDTANGWIKHFSAKTEEFQNQYFETLKQAGKCPVCGNEISETCKEKIGEVI